MNSHSSNIYKENIVKFVAILTVLPIFITITSSTLLALTSQTGCYKREGFGLNFQMLIEEFSASVPVIMRKGKVR